MGHVINNSGWIGAGGWNNARHDPERKKKEFLETVGPIQRDVVALALRDPLVLIVEDQPFVLPGLETICEFLGIQMELVNSQHDLALLLKTRRPMAVVCEIDSPGQDGCHVMKTIADYDRTLPVLVVTGDDPSLLGAAQAVEDIFNLTGVLACQRLPVIGELVEFLFAAGRKGRCLSLMPV